MTRINLVDPSVLTDKHLMAEYRELPRIFTAVRKLMDQGIDPATVDAPDKYVLGEGHVKFFYTRTKWLWDRYRQLTRQLIDRGFQLDLSIYNSVNNAVFCLFADGCKSVNYEPTPEEIYLNMARLCRRSGLDDVNAERVLP